MKRKIKVKYDGESPNACCGRLKIWVNNKLIYNKKYCCSSSGKTWIDDDSNEHVEYGILSWSEADKFDNDIQIAVSKVLSDISVCCGGCI